MVTVAPMGGVVSAASVVIAESYAESDRHGFFLTSAALKFSKRVAAEPARRDGGGGLASSAGRRLNSTEVV
jgi:hypothetical protein